MGVCPVSSSIALGMSHFRFAGGWRNRVRVGESYEELALDKSLLVGVRLITYWMLQSLIGIESGDD